MLAPGTLLHNRYLISQQLGQGGMGAVYEATDTKLDCLVAVKEAFTTTGEDGRKAFKHEAKLLANLNHPALPRVTDYFDQEGALFLVMQYVAGEDLHAMMLMRKAPCRVAEVMKWAEQLLDALDYLHTQTPPVIHRDIKPANIKLTSRNRVMLLDFGLAKGSAGLMSNVSRSVFGGTPVFAPPEQVEGTGTDPRSDIFSLAATIWSLLTFKIPPTVTTRMMEILGHRPDPLALASIINPEVPPWLAGLIFRSMSLSKEDRPPNAEAMREALLSSDSTATILDRPAPAKLARDMETVIESRRPSNEQFGDLLTPSGSKAVPKPSQPALPLPQADVSQPTKERSSGVFAGLGDQKNRRAIFAFGGAVALILVLAGIIGLWLSRRGASGPSQAGAGTVQQNMQGINSQAANPQASASPVLTSSSAPGKADAKDNSAAEQFYQRFYGPGSANSLKNGVTEKTAIGNNQAPLERKNARSSVSREQAKIQSSPAPQNKRQKQVSLDDLINDTNH